MIDYPYFRDVRSPVTPDQLRPLNPLCERVQFAEPLTDNDHKKIASLLKQYPDVGLRAYGHYGEKCDLEFLRHYPSLTNLSVEIFLVTGFGGLEKYVSPNLTNLGLGQTKSKAFSLGVLSRFKKLRSLYLEAHTKDIEAVGMLRELENLTLRSITLPDLSLLKPLNKLRSLDIKLGGTCNLDLLPEIGRIRYLELWMIRGLDSVEPVAAMRSLEYLFLQALKNVKKLPSLRRCHKLRRVHLETMKGLTDLRSVAEAPALEELLAIDMGQLAPEAFERFVGHPTLQRAQIGLGSLRKNRAVTELLGLPTVESEFEFSEATE